MAEKKEMMKKQLMFCCMISAGVCAADPTLPMKCVSHRGEEKYAPEASRPAFELAVERNADVVKLDIRFTRDGVVVLSHHATLKRTMGWDVPVKDLTFAEIREKGVFLEVGGYKNEKLLTLREALEIVGKCPEFWIDTKDFSPEGFERALAEFDRAGIAHDRIMVATFRREALRYVRDHHPEIRRVLHVYVMKMPEGQLQSISTKQDFNSRKELFAELMNWREEFDLYGFNLPKAGFRTGALTKRELDKLRAAGLWCSIWIIHDPTTAAKFSRMGADAIVTGNILAVRPRCARGTADHTHANHPK